MQYTHKHLELFPVKPKDFWFYEDSAIGYDHSPLWNDQKIKESLQKNKSFIKAKMFRLRRQNKLALYTEFLKELYYGFHKTFQPTEERLAFIIFGHHFDDHLSFVEEQEAKSRIVRSYNAKYLQHLKEANVLTDNLTKIFFKKALKFDERFDILAKELPLDIKIFHYSFVFDLTESWYQISFGPD